MAPAAHRWPLAAVFDCDGLLLETAHCWEAAYRAAAQAVGRSLDAVDLASLAGVSVAQGAERLAELLDRRVEESLLRRALQRAVEGQPIEPMPGVEEILRALSPELPLAVATNAPAIVVRTALRRVGLDGFFTTIVSAEQTSAAKPQPDVYVEACRLLGVDPSDAVAFEDSPLGAAAAAAAGLLVVAVPSVRGARMDADLTVARLDDHRVLELLGVRS
jgi:HAD superfamily hydrolase (TIGR01509 family)